MFQSYPFLCYSIYQGKFNLATFSAYSMCFDSRVYYVVCLWTLSTGIKFILFIFLYEWQTLGPHSSWFLISALHYGAYVCIYVLECSLILSMLLTVNWLNLLILVVVAFVKFKGTIKTYLCLVFFVSRCQINPLSVSNKNMTRWSGCQRCMFFNLLLLNGSCQSGLQVIRLQSDNRGAAFCKTLLGFHSNKEKQMLHNHTWRFRPSAS